MNKLFQLGRATIAVTLIAIGCGGQEAGGGVSAETREILLTNTADALVIARVNGIPILDRDVRFMADDPELDLDERQALDALVEQALLADEAQRRGWGSSWDFIVARRDALSRAMFRKVGRDTRSETLNEVQLKKFYEQTKSRYVHGRLRRVVHVVAPTLSSKAQREALAKKGENPEDRLLSDEKAEEVAGLIAESVAGATTAEEFSEVVSLFQRDYPGKLKLERLPPFDDRNKRFVSEFVEAAFAVESVGQASGAFKTSFGWHVLFVVEEAPPMNQSFEEVRESIAKDVIPTEKKVRVKKLLDDLYAGANVFIHEENLQYVEALH